MNEVRVYNADVTLVRVISKKEVTKLHWDKLVNSKGKKNVFHPAKNKTTTCENCDKKFPIIKGKVFKFCSPECRATGTSKKPKMEKKSKRSKGTHPYIIRIKMGIGLLIILN